MKARMRTIYLVNGFKGDCPKWAADIRALGQEEVTEVRVLWLGAPWKCWDCMTGTH